MTEFIVFSDIQFTRNVNKSKLLPNGLTTWFESQVQVVRDIFEYAEKNNITKIVHNGDLFEKKDKIDVNLYNAVWSLFNEYSTKFDLYLNTGNHDLALIKESSLKPFSAISYVVSEPTSFEVENTYIRLLPFNMVDGNLKTPEGFDHYLLFTHEDIADLTYGPLDMEGQSRYKTQIFSDWTYVFNGHIHKPQYVKNIINIGSPMVHDFGEAGEFKRFLHIKVDGTKIDIKSINTKHPEFIIINSLDEKLLKKIKKDKYNYYRIDVEQSEIGDKIFQEYNVSYKITKQREREERLAEDSTDLQDVEFYVNTFAEEGFNKQKLISLGLELLNKSCTVSD